MSAPTYDPLPKLSVTPAGSPATPAQPGAAFGLGQDVPAPPRTALAGLRERVKAARAKRYKDLRVPGLGDPDDPKDPEALFLRFVPLSASEQAAVMDADNGLTGFAAEWADAVNLIVRGCVGIFSVDATGEPVGAPSTWPRFTFELAEQLGLDLGSSTDRFGDLLREVFVADQDVVMMGQVYSTWLVTSSRPSERQSPEA